MTKLVILGLTALSWLTASVPAGAGSCSSTCSTIAGTQRCTYNCY